MPIRVAGSTAQVGEEQGPVPEQGDTEDEGDASDGAHQAAEGSQRGRFGEELGGDVAAVPAQGAAQADFRRALQDRDQGGVGDADRADHEADCGQGLRSPST